MLLKLAILPAVLLMSTLAFACPDILDHDMRILRSRDSINLCERYTDKPLLVVNTASHCGFTPQFEGLEALYQEYRQRGLRVAGFPSDDFLQEADSEAETARVCYVNYGVTFDMYAEIHVRGNNAHPLFSKIAAQSKAPKWNFYKYLVDASGNVVASFSSTTAPDSAELRAAIEALL